MSTIVDRLKTRFRLSDPRISIAQPGPTRPLEIQPEKNNDTSAFESGARVQLKPMGTSGTELFGGYFSEEYLAELKGKRGAKIFDEMRRSETQVAMLMNAIMNPIKAGKWEFEAADVPNGELHKDLVEFNAKQGIDWETHLHEALTMFIFGYSIFEVVHNIVYDHPKFGTFNGLKGLCFRSQKTIQRWIVDQSTGSLSAVEQWVQGDLSQNKGAIIQMLADFLVVFTLQKEGDNYEGISALRPMYGPWFRKNLYLKIAAIGTEKSAIGTPIGTVPANKQKGDEFERFKTVLENFTANESAYLIKPDGWNIEIIKGEFDVAGIKELILMENTEMINSLVANFLALGTNGGGGAFALGSDLSDFFLTGIQNYANVIAGVWNRKLIPDLIKLNYGPQEAYPTLKVTGINDKAGEELAKVLDYLTKSQIIKSDDKLEYHIRKQYSLPAADPATSRELINVTERISDPNVPPPGSGVQFSEKRIKLAETWPQRWKSSKADVKELMQKNLTNILDGYTKQIKSKWNGGTKASRMSIGLNLDAKGVNQYKTELRESLAEVANSSLEGARKDTPKAKNVKLSEHIQLAAPRGGYFNALPTNVKRIVQNAADLIVKTQVNDLEKIVSFQYNSSSAASDNIDQILFDVEGAAQNTIDGSTANGTSIDAAAGNAISSIENQARLEWFFEPDVLDTIESFTFTNEDPISEICQELDGTTWAVNDPDLDRYSPPLHHNCKSRLEPNEKGADGNPEIDGTGKISEKAKDQITLCECDWHLKFQLIEPGTGKLNA